MLVDVPEETTRLHLPEPGLILGVRHGGSASLLSDTAATHLPDTTLTGMTATARRMRSAASGGVILARFHPAGAAQFFAEPLHEIFGETIALDALLPCDEVDHLRSRVFEAEGDHERVAAFEAFLVARLRSKPPTRSSQPRSTPSPPRREWFESAPSLAAGESVRTRWRNASAAR